MSLADVARFFGAGRTTVYEARGEFAKLRRVRIGKKVMIPIEDVRALHAELQAAAVAVDEVGSEKLLKKHT
jgi:hypothetical protein